MNKILSYAIIITAGIVVFGIINAWAITGQSFQPQTTQQYDVAKDYKTVQLPQTAAAATKFVSGDIREFKMPSVEEHKNIQDSLFINPDGQAKITRGKIAAISPNGAILDIKIWGLILKADIANTMYLGRNCPLAEYPLCPPCKCEPGALENLGSKPECVCKPCPVLPPPCKSEIEKFNVGDLVNLMGRVADKNVSPPIIKAYYIKNISGTEQEINQIIEQIQKLTEKLKELQRQAGLMSSLGPPIPAAVVAPAPIIAPAPVEVSQ